MPPGRPTTIDAAASAFTPNIAARDTGLKGITLADIRRSRCDLKTVNLLGPVLALHTAQEAGAYEALLHRDGMITEGAATNAITRFGRALAAIGSHREPTTLTRVTTRFFASLAAVWPDAREASAMTDVSSGDAARVARGAEVLRATPTFDAVLRTGISPTILGGGIRSNVIPREAVATLNIRTLPG